MTTDNHDRRIHAVETGLISLGTAVAGLKQEALETRAEQTAILHEIRAELRVVAKIQTREAGVQEGLAMAAALASKNLDRRMAIMLALVGTIGVVVYWAGSQFIDSRVNAPRQINVEVGPTP